MLQVRGLAVNYGRVRAVTDLSFAVHPGELVCLLGANGAGKTTALHTIMGVLAPVRGQVHFYGREIGGWPSHRIVDLGLALVPEARQLFAHMSVRENLEVSFAHRLLGGLDRRRFEQRFEQVCGYLPRLAERRDQLAGTMSGGEQQMVAIGRSLMTDPKILLLDEPSLGLSPVMVDSLVDILQRLHQDGLGLLLVEQNAQVALEIADRAVVMENGRGVLEGPAKALLDDPRIQTAYLGV